MDFSLVLTVYIAAMIFAVTGVARVSAYTQMRAEWRLSSYGVEPQELTRISRRIRNASVMMILSAAVLVVIVVSLGFNEHPLGWPAFVGLVTVALVGRAKLRTNVPPNIPREGSVESSWG